MVRNAMRSLRIVALPMIKQKFHLPDSTSNPSRSLTGYWLTFISAHRLALKKGSGDYSIG